MKANFILEWKLFINNIKNQIVFILFILLCLFVTFVIEPNYQSWRNFEVEKFRSELEEAEYFIENMDSSVSPRMYEMFMNIYQMNPLLIQAMEEDWQTVLSEE